MSDTGGFIEKVESDLPLEISFSSWDEATLVVSGENWSFSTQSAWRVFEDGSILLGYLDKNSEDICTILNGAQIVAINFQNPERPVDLSFRLSTGQFLEVFSTDTSDPWVMNLPILGVCVGNGHAII